MAAWHIAPEDTIPNGFLCPACQEKIPPNLTILQECKCRFLVCVDCLWEWAWRIMERDPEKPTTCFQCRDELDISTTTPTQDGFRLPNGDEVRQDERMVSGKND